MGQIAVLGSTGMLGATLTRSLSSQFGPILEINRSGVATVLGNNVEQLLLSSSTINLEAILEKYKIDYVINAIGKIRQLIDFENDSSALEAWNLNTRFPRYLSNFCDKREIKLIQIGTDCVFSGMTGTYSETDQFDPIDLYGETKAFGELISSESMILRCSIIGLERNSRNSLLEWVLSHPQNAEIQGFENHIWNGVTTLDFARLVGGIISNKIFERGTFHVVPNDIVSKFELIQIISHVFDRSDLIIRRTQASLSVNRSLSTSFPEKNGRFWDVAGYTSVPTIQEMLENYANWAKVD
jgi:dTDP-4-dehydrorhamnose reductase